MKDYQSLTELESHQPKERKMHVLDFHFLYHKRQNRHYFEGEEFYRDKVYQRKLQKYQSRVFCLKNMKSGRLGT